MVQRQDEDAAGERDQRRTSEEVDVVMAYVVMACTSYGLSSYGPRSMAYIVMACTVMSYIVTADVVYGLYRYGQRRTSEELDVVMADIGIAPCRYGL